MARSASHRKYEPLKAKTDVHASITEKIAAAIEAGAGDFKMPWHRPGVAFTIPKNALTQKPYQGSNVLSLWIDADEKKFEHPVWATLKQWNELGARVQKGEKSSLIVKYGKWTPKSDIAAQSGAAQSGPANATEADIEQAGAQRLFAKAANVFNIDQVATSAELRGELLPEAKPRPDLTQRIARVDAFVAAQGIAIREGGQRAFYRHRSELSGDGDFIQMPERSLFTGTPTSTPTESYYSTLLHEEVHGSGASHRLNRQFGERFGDKAYAFEELVAEIGAAFLCAELEITNTPRPDHAQYVANWLAVLKGDNKAIFSAASLASRAVSYLIEREQIALGIEPQPERRDDDAHAPAVITPDPP